MHYSPKFTQSEIRTETCKLEPVRTLPPSQNSPRPVGDRTVFLKGPLCFLILLALFCLISTQSQAALDPRIHYETFETPHFTLLYDARHRELAQEYAQAAERAHQLLVPAFNGIFPSKTVLVIDDTTDTSNGFATPIPRQLITVYPVLPSPLDYLSHFGHWPNEIVTHEYTHTLNFEPAEGFWKPLRFVFGSVIRPNALLPRWYTEGLAVQNESKFTTMGRLRSPLYRAMIRAQVLEDTWGTEGLDRAADLTNPSWPRGTRPYFYGAFVWNRLVERKSDEIQGELNERYARRVPYLLHEPIQDLYNEDFNQFLISTYNDFRQIAQTQLENLKRSPSSDQPGGAFPNPDAYFQHSPQISPDRLKLAYIEKTYDRGDQIILRSRNDPSQSFAEAPAEILISNLDGVNRVDWSSDSSKILFNQIVTFDRYSSFSDLYLIELPAKKTKRITSGKRLREGTFTPDMKGAVAVQTAGGQTAIVGVQLDSGEISILYTPERLSRVSNPSFLDQGRLIFSERTSKGVEGLRLLNTLSKESQLVLSRYEPLVFAHPSPRGLIFQSTKSGSGNLYLANTELTEAIPLTHTLTHVFNGTLDDSRNLALTVRLTASGARLEEHPALEIKEPLPLPSTGLNDGYNFGSFFEPEPTALDMQPRPYSAGRYLLPKYWLPILLSGPYGSQFGGTVFGSDPLSFHSYAIGGFYDSQAARPGWLASYTNRQTPVTIGLAGQQVSSYVESLRLNNDQLFLSGRGTFFLPGLSNDWRGFVGWTFYQSQYAGSGISTQQGPTVGLSFDNTSMKGYQISPQEGWSWTLSHSEYLRGLATDNYGRTQADVTTYTDYLLPKNHALKLAAAGTYSPANRSLFVGTVSAGGEYLVSSANPPLVVRGYSPGAFIGWSFLTTSMEYRFPIAYPFSGKGTAPWFLRRTHGAVFWDALTTEGAYAHAQTNRLTRSYFGNFYSGVGAEVRFDLTVAYMVPLTARIGYHYGLREYAYGGGGLYLGVILPQF